MVSPLPANVNLVQLLAAAPATALTGGEPFETVQSGTSVAATANQILSFAQANTTVAGLSVAGVAGTASGPIASITGTTDQVLRIASNGTTLGFGAINLATSAAVTGSLPLANITSIVGLSVLGVTGTATATMAALTGTTDQVLRVAQGGTTLGFGAINLATSAAVTGVLGTVNGGIGTSTLGQIPGTNTTSSASVGNVGEYISIQSTSTSITTTSVGQALASMSLSPGDWNIWCSFQFSGTATSVVTLLAGSLSATSGSIDTTNFDRYGEMSGFGTTIFASANIPIVPVGPSRLSLAATTVIFANAFAAFSASSCSAAAKASARRVR